jgi:hypothetical protein
MKLTCIYAAWIDQDVHQMWLFHISIWYRNKKIYYNLIYNGALENVTVEHWLCHNTHLNIFLWFIKKKILSFLTFYDMNVAPAEQKTQQRQRIYRKQHKQDNLRYSMTCWFEFDFPAGVVKHRRCTTSQAWGQICHFFTSKHCTHKVVNVLMNLLLIIFQIKIVKVCLHFKCQYS